MIGLRLAAGGDELDVACHALCADSPAITSPVPTHATAVTRADDGLSILLSELSASSSYSVYIDHDAPDDDSTSTAKSCRCATPQELSTARGKWTQRGR